jgi:hypothetical protein
MNLLGPLIGEGGWGESLDLDRSTPGGAATEWLCRNVIDFMRLMVKFEEFDKHPEEYDFSVEQFALARELGVQTVLVTDIFNRAKSKSEYHRYVYLPTDMRASVGRMIADTQPDMIQVCNEPWSGYRNLTHREYRDFVHAHVLAAKDEGWTGLIVAEQPRSEYPGKVGESWVWSVSPEHGTEPDFHWENCAEGTHKWDERDADGSLVKSWSSMVHEIPSAARLRDIVSSMLFLHKYRPVGWHWPVICETS